VPGRAELLDFAELRGHYGKTFQLHALGPPLDAQ
jgi:hypothetical protein